MEYNPYLPNRRYDYSKAARLADLFPEEFIDKLPMGRKRTRPYSEKKRRLVHSVFLNFLDILQDHLIETGHKYVLPTYPIAWIYICEKTEIEVQRIHGNGKNYKFVNPILSDGKYYQMVFYCKQIRYRKRWIRMDYKRYLELADRVNKGQRYFYR